MFMLPTVSVICLCYNHQNFVYEAIQSVAKQTYQNIEIIIVDDASTDDSIIEIQEAIADFFPHKQIVCVFLPENIGNCKAFNIALQKAKGKYVIDFATDDLLLPHRITSQVDFFEKLSEKYAVVFSNAQYIDGNGTDLTLHHQTTDKIPVDDIYREIVAHSFICTPTMMMRKTVLDELGGYDESLSYEDFDFWIRSARNYLYAYQNEVLTHKRKVNNSLGSQFYTKKAYSHLVSTLKICYKIAKLNQNKAENQALAHRLRYHMRLCCYTNNFELVQDYYQLLSKIDNTNPIDGLWLRIAKYKLPLYQLYRIYWQFFQF